MELPRQFDEETRLARTQALYVGVQSRNFPARYGVKRFPAGTSQTRYVSRANATEANVVRRRDVAARRGVQRLGRAATGRRREDIAAGHGHGIAHARRGREVLSQDVGRDGPL